MNILATQYTLGTKSLEIYLAGCKGNPHCTNCHNPTSWDFTSGKSWVEAIPTIEAKLLNYGNLIDNIMVMGGEPLDQPHITLMDFTLELFTMADREQLWLFTRYDLADMPEFIKNHYDYIKCGRYIEEKRCSDNKQYGIVLASSNQKIYAKGIDF